MHTREVRYAVRRLKTRPGPSLVCVGLLAVGIGLCTVIFSAVDAVLLQPAPFRDADRLVQQTMGYSEPALVEAWRASGMFEAVEAGRVTSFQFQTPMGPLSQPAAAVTPGVFDLLRVRPLRGRTFTRESAGAATTDEVILSEVVWRAVFGKDPTLLGRRIQVDGGEATVVGIMPSAFRFPTPMTVAWRPFHPMPREPGGFTIFGRMKPGVPMKDLDERTRAMAYQLARLPRNYLGGPPLLRVGQPALRELTGRALWLLLAGAALVFVVLCANVSGLILSNLSVRRREFGICTALGASRARLIREATVEQMLIAILGTAGGAWLASALMAFLPAVFQGHTLNIIDLDVRALVVASSLGGASVLLAGLVPAWLGTRTDPAASLRGGQGTSETRAARMATGGLLVVEVALACSLLIGSLLLVRSFAHLRQTNRGLNADGVVRVRVLGLDHTFLSAEAMSLAMAAIEDQFAGWPAISGVALSREIPPGPTQREAVHLGAPGSKPDPILSIPSDSYRVSASFFELYGMPILRGRPFASGDTARDVIVSQRLAELLWPGADPLGRSFSAGRLSEARRVIGVVGEARLPTLDPALERPEFYTPLGNESRTLFVNIRCRGACPNETALQAKIQAVHPSLRARHTSLAEEAYRAQLELPRATAAVGGLFGVVGVFTAAVGLFTVLAHAVGRRRREFGIRTALGASPRQIRYLVIRYGITVAGLGMTVGIFGGLMVGQSLAVFLYGVTGADAVAWACGLVTITLTSLAAAWYPARQAARIDPVALLRNE